MREGVGGGWEGGLEFGDLGQAAVRSGDGGSVGCAEEASTFESPVCFESFDAVFVG